jgi:hypothetical protein
MKQRRKYMNGIVVYLIITMGSAVGLGSRGFGGVSVTQTPSMEECMWIKGRVRQQILLTDNLYMDDDEILVTCKRGKRI